MLSLSSLIEFLMDMLRDDTTQADFARDPSGTLAARGLSGVTAQDVRDVQPMLADVGGVRPVAHESGVGAHPVHHAVYGGHDVIHAIHHISHGYEVARPPVTHVTEEFKSYNTYKTYTEFHQDNSIHADHGSSVTIGVDNRGGVIDHSTVVGHDATDTGNTSETTTEIGSHNDDHAQLETGSHNTTVGQHLDDVGNHGGQHDPHPVPAPVHHPPVVHHPPLVVDDPEPAHDAVIQPYQQPPAHSSGTYEGHAEGLHDSYAVHEPAASVDVDDHAAALGHPSV